MAPKRVLIYVSGFLLSAGLYSLLAGRNEFDVTSVTQSSPERLAEMIKNLKPEVIILDDSALAWPREILIESLERGPQMKAIVVNQEDNHIRLCDEDAILVKQISDFIDVI